MSAPAPTISRAASRSADRRRDQRGRTAVPGSTRSATGSSGSRSIHADSNLRSRRPRRPRGVPCFLHRGTLVTLQGPHCPPPAALAGVERVSAQKPIARNAQGWHGLQNVQSAYLAGVGEPRPRALDLRGVGAWGVRLDRVGGSKRSSTCAPTDQTRQVGRGWSEWLRLLALG